MVFVLKRTRTPFLQFFLSFRFFFVFVFGLVCDFKKRAFRRHPKPHKWVYFLRRTHSFISARKQERETRECREKKGRQQIRTSSTKKNCCCVRVFVSSSSSFEEEEEDHYYYSSKRRFDDARDIFESFFHRPTLSVVVVVVFVIACCSWKGAEEDGLLIERESLERWRRCRRFRRERRSNNEGVGNSFNKSKDFDSFTLGVIGVIIGVVVGILRILMDSAYEFQQKCHQKKKW